MASPSSGTPDMAPFKNAAALEKSNEKVRHVEHVPGSPENLEYYNIDEEPELHLQTYIALAAMFFLNMVQVFALQGPPAAVRLFPLRPTFSCH